MAHKSVTTAVLVAGLAVGAAFSASAADKPKGMMGASASMLANTCAGCHGTGGNSQGPSAPTIAGISGAYFVEVMQGFASGEVPSTIMGRIAKGYTEDEIYEAFTRHWKGTLLAFLIQSLATFFVYMRPQVFFHFSAHTTFSFPQLSLLFTLNIMLSFFLWITPGGLGTSEAALIGIYKLVGVGKEGAVAFSLVFKFVELLFVVVGLTYLFNRGLRRISRRSEDRLSACPTEKGSDPPFAGSNPTDTPQKER